MALMIVPELAASSQRRARQIKHEGYPTCQTPSYPRPRTSAEPTRVARCIAGGTLDSVLCCECASPVRPERNAPSPSVSATAVPATPFLKTAHIGQAYRPARSCATSPARLTSDASSTTAIHTRELHYTSQHPGRLPYALCQPEPCTIAGQSVCALCRHQACARRPFSTRQVRMGAYTSPPKLRAPQ